MLSHALVMLLSLSLAVPAPDDARPGAAGWHRGGRSGHELARRRKDNKDGKAAGERKEDEDEKDEEGKPFVEEPPDLDTTPARPPEVYYPDESPGQDEKDQPGKTPEERTPPPGASQETEAGEPQPSAPPAREPTRDDRATSPREKPAPEEKTKTGPEPTASPERQRMFRVEVFGGLRVPRNYELQFGGGALCAVDLGSLVGWRGLYLFVEQDAFAGEDQLGDISYVLLDTLGGLQGRFAAGPVRLLAGIGFGVRLMAVTENQSEPRREPETGFGVVGMAGVGVPLGDLVSLLVRADARYMKNPLSGQFTWSGVFVAGAGVSF